MPQVSNYQDSFIYKFVCNDLEITDTYVGASCVWIKRKSEHKSRCNNEKNTAYERILNIYINLYVSRVGGTTGK